MASRNVRAKTADMGDIDRGLKSTKRAQDSARPGDAQTQQGSFITSPLVDRLGKMIIRESPSPAKSGSGLNWPPKSAFDASQCSPSRKRRIDATGTRNSTSPSPSKRSKLTTSNNANDSEGEGEDDADDDEETLQLKLKAIEARLKLKKLQKAKENSATPADGLRGKFKSVQKRNTPSAPPVDLHVPLSPGKQLSAPVNPDSPKRVQLGIDKGLKAGDVSLKRAKEFERRQPTFESRHIHGNRSRPNTIHQQKPKSFGERIAEARDRDDERQRREQRRVEGQQRGFGLEPHRTGQLQKTQFKGSTATPLGSAATTSSKDDGQKSQVDDGNVEEPPGGDEEKYSRFRLSKQKLSNDVLAQALDDKDLFPIRRLLKTVVAPDYDPPDIENDYVVFGIIAWKSDPFEKATTHKMNSTADPGDDHQKPNTSKFMYLKLTDLEYEITLFLFDSAFDAFWKLTVGTVVGILNPGIMPPKQQARNNGQFSLKLGSSEDTILEIGNSLDLFFCKSIKKDGKQCTQWLDKRKTEYCDFHINLKAEKTKATRMEINGMVGLGMFGAGRNKNSGRGGHHNDSRGGRGGKNQMGSKEGSYYDREAREVAYQVRGMGKTTAKLLDAEDYGPGGLNNAEKSRLRMAAQQKERELAEALGSQGSGMGGQYMRLRKGDANKLKRGDCGLTQSEKPLDAVSMGLTSGTADAVRLSPGKGSKLRGSALNDAMGWSGAFKRGLLESDQQTTKLPAEAGEKRARFALDKGIRIPGKESRESLPGNSLKPKPATVADDDDDGLDII